MLELWDVVDRHGRKTGAVVERGQPLPEGQYHPVVDVWIKNKQGHYLISRRCPHKYPYPGLWEPTCGSVVSGESSLAGALREVQEELGLTLAPACGQLVKSFCTEGDASVDVWLFEQEIDIDTVILQPGETDCAMWADADEIRRLAAAGQFINHERLPYLDALLTGTDN